MRKVLRVGKDVKARRSRVKELMDLRLSALEMDVELQLIQELIPSFRAYARNGGSQRRGRGTCRRQIQEEWKTWPW